MPQKQSGKLAQYVHRAGDGGTFDDLKAEVPDLSNSKKPRSNKSHETRAVTTRNSQASRESRRGTLAEPNPFYDTEASGIDDTSTTVSMPTVHNGGGHGKHHDVQADDESGPDSPLKPGEEYTSGEESDDEDNNLPTHPLKNHPSNKQKSSVNAPETQQRHQPDGRRLPYIKGDSYPSTTNGVPSVSDVPDEERQMMPPISNNLSRPGQLPSLPGTHGQNQAVRRQSGEQQPQNGGQQRNGPFRNPAVENVQVEHLNPYAQAGPKRLATRQGPLPVAKPATFDSTTNQQSATQQPPSTNSAQIGSTDRGQARMPLPQTAMLSTTVPNPVKATTPPNEERMVLKKRGNNNRVITPTEHVVQHKPPQHARIEQQRPEQPPQYEQTTPEVFSDGSRVQHKQEEEVEDRPALDHDLPALYKMGYSELKAATFDVDPNSDAVSVGGQSLEENLQNASSLQPKLQASFFTTLDIGQWEQAGDWFLGRFGNIMGQLKRARQEKRKAAREFEDEIEKRHNAIDKKRKFTDDALSDMKMSGGKVLQGTPKKPKKTQ
ncbi:hypothetical protein LTS10_002728 [Elasticomyces elasticus]|nr:hypothetical protein LTS10_002728 [Elasticomyces elasticus]